MVAIRLPQKNIKHLCHKKLYLGFIEFINAEYKSLKQ